MGKRARWAGLMVLFAASVWAGGGLTKQYVKLLTSKPPGRAELGVDVFPSAVLRVNQSAQLMAANFPDDNRPGKPPGVYSLEYFVPNGDFKEVVAFYAKFAKPGTTPQENGQGTQSAWTRIELDLSDVIKQRIIVTNAANGLGCTTSWNEDYSAKCVTIHVTARARAASK